MRETDEDVCYKGREVFYKNLLRILQLIHKRDFSGGFLHKGFNVGGWGVGGLCPDTNLTAILCGGRGLVSRLFFII